ncbi:MAG: hypothetical protein KKC68_00200 [Candidatus Thermoplasmatota archaeon]|nr:hypothetical protein [Candidatus Thermoplasmatota archaeon]MBU1940172.1 hypothetical protein [Candidatus Thermoplasmatota archaeon]
MEKPLPETQINPYYYELELIHPMEQYLTIKGYIVQHEVKIGFCRADLVGFKKNEVLAVELKLKEWNKALIQARNYQLGADYVYIGIPLLRAGSLLRKKQTILESEGIGVYTINEKSGAVHQLLPAQPSSKKFGTLELKPRTHHRKKPRQLL